MSDTALEEDAQDAARDEVTVADLIKAEGDAAYEAVDLEEVSDPEGAE